MAIDDPTINLFSNMRGNAGPLTGAIMDASRRKRKKGQAPGGEQPNQTLLGPGNINQQPLGPQNTNESILGPRITAGLGAKPAPAAPGPAPTGVPMGQGYWGGNVKQSPTGPGEERMINNMTSDNFRTTLLRHEGSKRAEGADSTTGDHVLYRDADGWATGYGQTVTPEVAAELGIDMNNPDSIANARVQDEWARNKFAEKSASVYQQGGEYLAELGLPTSGPLADIVGNMMYQMGDQGVRGFTDMATALRKGDTTAAAKAMLDSEWAKEQTPGRAEELAQQMQSLGQLKTGLSS